MALRYAAAIFLCVSVMGGMGPLAGAMTGVGLNVLTVGRMFQVKRRFLRVRGALERLRGPDASAAPAELDCEIEGIRGGRGAEKSDYDSRARSILTIAAQVWRAGHPERALDWATRIEGHVLSRQTAAMHAQVEAALRLSTNDRAGARRALGRASRPAIGGWEDALAAMDALLETLEGDAQAATDRATRAVGAQAEHPAQAIWQMARAHAMARIGAAEEAHDALLSIRREGGDELVRRVVGHGVGAREAAVERAGGVSVGGERRPRRGFG